MFKYYLYFVLLLLGFFFIRIFLDLLKAWKSNSWPQTEGKITESKVLSLGRSMMIGKNYERYSALIRYQYRVSDREFESDRIKFFPMGTSVSKKRVENLVSLYSKGDVVDVFYNSDKPHEALLEAGLNSKAFFSLIAISFFIGIIVLMIQAE